MMSSHNNTSSFVMALEDNPHEVYLEITTILLKLADNILKEPSNPKYRRIRLSNPIVANKLLQSVGAMECLFSMGFEEGEDSLILPQNYILDNLRKIRDDIFHRRKCFIESSSKSHLPIEQPGVQSTQASSELSTSQPSQNASISRTAQQQLLSFSSQYCSTSNEVKTQMSIPFLKKIAGDFQAVLQYEDKKVQAEAIKLIPITELEITAMKSMRNLQLKIKQGTIKESEVDIQEFVLIALLNWFKMSFFKWVDTPECEKCKGVTKLTGVHIDSSNPSDTHRVEVYECMVCKERTLFPRYNDVTKLLQTRKGRCGEWANCFTLFCRTLGWDARHVIDETDHVWTEVYSETQGRWLHCDPCENAFDTPLMYEYGWGKELSYVMAYSRDDIQDVTWRYSSNHKTILSRRTKCSEAALLSNIMKLRQERQVSISTARRAYLNRRLAKELVEFLLANHPSKIEKQGRSSGSLAWRLARGEIEPEEAKPYLWTATNDEIEAGEMRVLYSAALDKYIRPNASCTSQGDIQSFYNGAYEVKSIIRKEEHDWKKVYLARTVGSDHGRIRWKFDVGEQVVVDQVIVTCRSQVYENGQVRWLLCSEHSCINLPDHVTFSTDSLSGASSVTLTAELTGGTGDNAWQHAQLFRQDLDNYEEFPLKITLTFRKKN